MIAYETTDMLLRKRHIATDSHLILWQPGLIGAFGPIANHDNRAGVALLKKYLQQFYPISHMIIAYEAALYPHVQPRIEPFRLSEI